MKKPLKIQSTFFVLPLTLLISNTVRLQSVKNYLQLDIGNAFRAVREAEEQENSGYKADEGK